MPSYVTIDICHSSPWPGRALTSYASCYLVRLAFRVAGQLRDFPSTPRPRICAALFVTSVCATLAAAPIYSVTDLGTLGGSFTSSGGINNAGQVTGWSSYTTNDEVRKHAFLYSGGTITDLGTLSGDSFGYRINNAGQVAGYSHDPATGDFRAFLYSGGTMIDIGTLGGIYSFGYAINNAGEVTGRSYTAGTSVFHAFLYSRGTMTDLGTLGGSISYGYGINDAGQVTGRSDTAGDSGIHAFLYSGGKMIDLGPGIGRAINNAGQVTGEADSHAFLYSGGTMTDLGTLGGSFSESFAINNAGQVTGWSMTAGDAAEHAFLYSGGIMIDLNDLIDPSLNITLLQGAGINDAGQIVVNATNGHAYLLSPVPEPGTGPLLPAAFAALFLVRRASARRHTTSRRGT